MLTLPCDSKGFPLPRVEWMKDERVLTNSSVKHFVSANNSLVLVSVKKNHEGKYTCCARNHLAESTDWVVVRVKGQKSVFVGRLVVCGLTLLFIA